VNGEVNAEVSERHNALRRQLHWLYNQLLGDSGNRHLDGTLSREVAQHEAALQQLEWRNAPLLAQARPVQLAELQAILQPDQQALTFYFAGNEILAFVVGRDDASVVRHVTTVDAVNAAMAELRFQLGRAEVGGDYVVRHAERLRRGSQEALQRLYILLIEPLRQHLEASRLLIIPYGVLHLIPFHALWDGSRYWLEEVEISYVPSASIAVHKRSPHSAKPWAKPLASFAGFAPYDERIPQAQAEIDSAATFFGNVMCYTNESATIAKLKEAAASSDVLHLATHGLFRPDNSFFSALKLADGWIDVRELYRLKLSARLVVLSACESGVGDVRAGDEVVGLARGFLAAGAQKLVASLWNVHDRSAAELMGNFYNVLQGEEAAMQPAAALRSAQLIAVTAGQHPYFWAPFFAIG
jgi:CHAT domain-containing protein